MEQKKYKLGDICDIIAGGDAPLNVTPEKTETNIIPVYSNGIVKEGLYGYTDKARIITKAFTVSARGTIGVSFLRNQPFFPIVRLLSVIPNSNEVDLDYLYYYSKLLRFEKDGSVQQQLTVPMLSNIEVRLLPYSTQCKVASILSTLDHKIALNRAINRNLEALAKQLYDYWFVQFDFPDEKGRPYKSSGGKMVWNEVLKREVPEGWEAKRLGDAVEIKRGKTITEKQTSQGNVKVVAAGLDFSYYHNQSNRDAYCITVSGSGENAGFVNFWREPIYASDCSTIQFEDVIDTLLCYYTLKMQEQRFYRISHKSAQPHVLPSDIAEIPMVFPEVKVKERIRDFLIDSNRIIGLNTREIERLSHQRDDLLPLLMNGQVTIE